MAFTAVDFAFLCGFRELLALFAVHASSPVRAKVAQ
jgi:hypothetical protein